MTEHPAKPSMIFSREQIADWLAKDKDIIKLFDIIKEATVRADKDFQWLQEMGGAGYAKMVAELFALPPNVVLNESDRKSRNALVEVMETLTGSHVQAALLTWHMGRIIFDSMLDDKAAGKLK